MEELKNIETMLKNLDQLPVGAIRALFSFDLSQYIKDRLEISSKDKARVAGFVPAVLQRAADLGVSVGFQLGLKKALDEGIEPTDFAVAYSEDFANLVKEAGAVALVFFDQARTMQFGDFDPFKDEREIARIFAKKWSLKEDYQKLLGVSDETPDTYPDTFVSKYLNQ